MEKKLKFNQPKKLPLPDDYVSSINIKFSPTTDESYIGKNMGISGGTTPSHKLDVKTLKDGYIRIGMDRGVYFEYYGLPKPEKIWFETYDPKIQKKAFNRALIEYEASKQLIEVSNVLWMKVDNTWSFSGKSILDKMNGIKVKNNQPCKAEITNNKATIVELTKK